MHGRPEPKHLLDTQADQNIGNGFILQPQAGGATVVPQSSANSSSYERILMLTGPSSTGQTTSIVLTASRLSGPNNPYPGFPGPITGIIEFGNGGQFTKVEVDIPIGPFVGDFQTATPATEPQDGGVIVTVPTGVLRVYARYDNQLIQPVITALNPHPGPPQSLAQLYNKLHPLSPVLFLGPGGPIQTSQSTVPPEPVQVKAMAAFFSRHTSKVYRTQYCFVSLMNSGQAVPVSGQYFCVPPFARSVKVLRAPFTTPLTITLLDNQGHFLEGPITIGPSSSPTIPLVGTETIVSLNGATGPVNITLLALCYEIGI